MVGQQGPGNEPGKGKEGERPDRKFAGRERGAFSAPGGVGVFHFVGGQRARCRGASGARAGGGVRSPPSAERHW